MQNMNRILSTSAFLGILYNIYEVGINWMNGAGIALFALVVLMDLIRTKREQRMREQIVNQQQGQGTGQV